MPDKNQPGNKLDLILETPGGSAEVVEDLVKNIRGRFSEVAIIIMLHVILCFISFYFLVVFV